MPCLGTHGVIGACLGRAQCEPAPHWCVRESPSQKQGGEHTSNLPGLASNGAVAWEGWHCGTKGGGAPLAQWTNSCPAVAGAGSPMGIEMPSEGPEALGPCEACDERRVWWRGGGAWMRAVFSKGQPAEPWLNAVGTSDGQGRRACPITTVAAIQGGIPQSAP